MKVWERYSEYLQTGEWHIHTSYTDGKNTIEEYCMRAVQLGVPLIAFTEHVRKNLTYNFDQFLSDIQVARETYDLIILSGCEAKVLPNGTPDADHDILSKVDYPIFSYHSFPPDPGLYLDTLHMIIQNPFVNAWAHPASFFRGFGIDLSSVDLESIYEELNRFNVLVEINKKYDQVFPALNALVERYEGGRVRGSDCHTVDQLVPVNSQ